MDPARVYSFSRSKNTSTSWSSSTTASLVSCGVDVTNNSFDMFHRYYFTGKNTGGVLGGIFSLAKEQARALWAASVSRFGDGSFAQIRCTFSLLWSCLVWPHSPWNWSGAVTHPGMDFFCRSFRPGTALCRRYLPFL